jgi:hypothetical protein
MARCFTSFHGAGNVDRAREQQELFGERRLTRIWVRNDCERAAFFDVVGKDGTQLLLNFLSGYLIYCPIKTGRSEVSHSNRKKTISERNF